MNTSGNGRTVADVATDVTVECVDDRGLRHEIDAVLGYRRSDPYAVTMTFITGDGNLTWTFGRDLLSHGTSAPVGDGDVHVWPSIDDDGHASVNIELTSPDGHLVLAARTQDVSDFVSRTHLVVPEGNEGDHLDMESLITQVLSA